MNTETLQQFANTRGYKASGATMTGVFGGYPFLSTLKSQKINTLTTVITISGGLRGKIGRQIKKQLPKRCSFLWSARPTLICSGSDDELFTVFASAMDTVTSALRDAGIALPQKCPICNAEGCDALAIQNGAFVPVHQSCCQERSYATAVKAEDNARSGSYITGIIGAILGGILATVPSLLTIWFMERIYSVLFILIPLGIYYGYRLFRGKMNKAVGVITVLLSLVMPFVLEQLVFYVAVATTYSILPSILDTAAFYFQIVTPAEMVSDLAMPYVFLLFGIFVTFKQITRTSSQEVADAAAVLDTMLPYGDASSVPASWKTEY